MPRSTSAPRLHRLESRLSEAFDELYDSLVDPHEPLTDADGTWWPLGDGSTAPSFALSPPQLRDIRHQCRVLALTNEFALNGHENRINYLVGTGHVYRCTAKKHQPTPEQLPSRVQGVLDEFLRDNDWRRRQEEIVRRRDRDGEAILRFFLGPDGTTRVRFVEPDQLVTPTELADDPAHSYGIHVDRDDVETVLAYYIDGQPVAAADIQHRKGNVDSNVKRGLPLFYPVRKNLRRAEKLLRNMSVLAEIQSAIALIRKHHGATSAGVQQFAAAQSDATRIDPATGKQVHARRYAPGTIVDATAGIDYDFPAANIDAGSFVAILQAELRAIASRLVMPEFMLTSDASNANYASTLVAEGPAVKMFQRLQQQLIDEDLQVMWRVVEQAIRSGRLPAETRDLVEIQVAPPQLVIRDELKQVQALAIEHEQGVLSTQTWSQRRGYDFDQEQTNRSARENSAPTRVAKS